MEDWSFWRIVWHEISGSIIVDMVFLVVVVDHVLASHVIWGVGCPIGGSVIKLFIM